MFRIAICEKETEKRNYLMAAVSTIAEDISAREFRNLDDLKESMDEAGSSFDMILLNTTIHREGDGLDFAAWVRRKNVKVGFVFITKSQEYYARAFQVFATGYLLYPFDVRELQNCINFFNQKTVFERRASIMIKEKGGKWGRIFLRNITFIESDNRDIRIHLEDGQEKISYQKLSQVESQLTQPNFVRCHQSYLVNLYFVDELAHNQFIIKDQEIPISRKYQKEARESYYNYMFSKI